MFCAKDSGSQDIAGWADGIQRWIDDDDNDDDHVNLFIVDKHLPSILAEPEPLPIDSWARGVIPCVVPAPVELKPAVTQVESVVTSTTGEGSTVEVAAATVRKPSLMAAKLAVNPAISSALPAVRKSPIKKVKVLSNTSATLDNSNRSPKEIRGFSRSGSAVSQTIGASKGTLRQPNAGGRQPPARGTGLVVDAAVVEVGRVTYRADAVLFAYKCVRANMCTRPPRTTKRLFVDLSIRSAQ